MPQETHILVSANSDQIVVRSNQPLWMVTQEKRQMTDQPVWMC